MQWCDRWIYINLSAKSEIMKIGVLGAMAQEIDEVKTLLQNVETKEIADRVFHSGTINGTECVIAFSKWGKVAATMTSAIMINEFKVNKLIFIGTAGALSSDLNIGDVVVAQNLVQHDIDSRPIQKRFEIPLINKIFIETDSQLDDIAARAIESLIGKGNGIIIDREKAEQFSISQTKLHRCDIASGDQFINNQSKRDEIAVLLPSVKCVEMEGAAVAQVCYEFKIPFTVIRIISDSADHNARFDFGKFIVEVANAYSKAIIGELMNIIR